MPSAADIAANKARSQARQIILALRLRGHKNADIARAINVEASAIQRIVKGDTPGDALLPALQRAAAQVAGLRVSPPQAPETPAETPAVGIEPEAAELPEPVGGSLPADLGAIEAPEPEQAPKRGAVDRIKAMMLGGDAQIAAPVSKGGKGADAQRGAFVAQVLPVVALAVVLGADLSIKEPFKPCAPTQPEAEAMLREPIKWLARELDVRGRLTENTMATLITLLAVAAYAKRAHGTYKRIKADQVGNDRARAGAGASANDASAAATVGYTAGGHGGAGDHPADHAGHGAGRGDRSGGQRPDAIAAPRRHGGVLRRPGAGGPDQPATRPDDFMAAVLAADYEGRLRLGMVG